MRRLLKRLLVIMSLSTTGAAALIGGYVLWLGPSSLVAHRGGIPRTVDVGDAAPDFTVIGEDGQRLWLTDLHGRWVVLVFLRAHW